MKKLTPLTKQIGNLSSLKYLDLGTCKIFETLPSSLGSLTRLTYYDVLPNVGIMN
jgi:Leucine-rich repeat (LRR) protein